MSERTAFGRQLRSRYPLHAVMIADHPADSRFRTGHYFFFARRGQFHTAVLHQSDRCVVMIPNALLELFDGPATAEPTPQPPNSQGTPSPEDRLNAYLQQGGTRP